MGVLQTGQILPPEQQGLPQRVASDSDQAAHSAPSFWQTTAAAYSSAKDQTPAIAEIRLREAYNGLAEQVAKAAGKDVSAYYPGGVTDTHADPARVWSEINGLRVRDPGALKDIGSDQADFEKRVLTRGGAHQIDAATAAAGGWVPKVLGGAAAGVNDPFMWVAGMLGGPEVTLAGRGILMNGLARLGVAAGTNAAFAAAEEPLTVGVRQKMGETVTAGDVSSDIGSAAVFGAGFHATGEALRPVLRPVMSAANTALRPVVAPVVNKARDVFEAGLGHVYAAMPDHVLADHFASAVPSYERMPAEQAALHVIGRQAEIDASNPFQASHAAMAVHQARLAEAGAALDAGRVPGSGPAFLRPTDGGVNPGYYAKIGHAENATGDPNASPGTSSARGLYQFTDGTWLATYKARFGARGQSDAQIIALKGNADLQNTLVRDLTEHNAAQLRGRGLPTDDASLYLAHVLGPADAERVLRADPGRPLEGLIHDASIRANRPIMAGKTAGEFRAWAARKMGGSAPESAAGTFAAPDAGGDGGAAAAAADQADASALDAEEAQATMADRSEEDFSAPSGPHLPETPLAAQTIMPALRALIADKSVRLNDFEALAQQLGATAEDVRSGLNRLAGLGEIGQRKDNGAFTRARPPSRELSLIEWIKENGGIYDGGAGDGTFKGGDLAAMDLNDWYKGGPFRDKKPIINNSDWARQNRGHDTVLRAAVVEGYFPELRGALDAAGPDTLDPNHLLHAIDEELRGRPSYKIGTKQWEKQVKLHVDPTWHPTPEEVPSTNGRTFEEAFGQFEGWADTELRLHTSFIGRDVRTFDPWIFDRTHYLWHERGVSDIGRAFDQAVNDYAAKNAAEALAATGEKGYGDVNYEWPTYHDAERGGESGAATGDSSGPESAGGGAQGGEPRSGADGSLRGETGGEYHGPVDPEAFAEYSEPTGPRIAQAADSAWHDLEQQIDPALAERQRTEAQLRAEAPLRGGNKTGQAQDGVMGLGLFDSSDQPVFDLQGGDREAQISAIKAALDADQAALDEITSCLKPGGGAP